ncbi:MAG: hypothetical protein SWK76_09215 [Actinomycetota bacterium]|nr:hypothetical protein [Actinomycetota bacterium]
MMSENIDLYWFSCTGNTLLVAREMAEVLQDKGFKVVMLMMERPETGRIELDHAIGLAFPVACQFTFPLVWDFVRGLPKADGTEVFMVDTLQGFSGGVVGPRRKLLAGRGYKPVGAREIIMPSSYYPRRLDGEKTAREVDRGLEKARCYASDLADGISRWRSVPLLSTPCTACPAGLGSGRP